MFYLYRHIRNDTGNPFYIGIGTKSKQDLKYGYYSRANAKHVDNNIWMKIAAKTTWFAEILYESDDRAFICEKEKEFIQLYGRMCDNTGILCNLTTGGEENMGYKHSDETRKKISDIQKGKPRGKGRKFSQEVREKFSRIQKEVANRPDRIEYRRQIATGNKYMLGYKFSDESKRKMSESAKKRGANAKVIKCRLINKITGETWEAESIAALSKLTPISLSSLSRFSQGVKMRQKMYNTYEFVKL